MLWRYLVNNFINSVYPKKYLDYLNNRLAKLGSDGKISLSSFLISRLVIEFLLFIVLILIPVYGIILSFLFTILFHYLYEDILINAKILKRKEQLDRDIAYFLEAYSLALESNFDVKASFLVTAKLIDNSFTKEIRERKNKYFNLNDLLSSLKNTIPNEDIAEDLLLIEEGNKENTVMAVNNMLKKLAEESDAKIDNTIKKVPIKIILASLVFLALVLILLVWGPKYL